MVHFANATVDFPAMMSSVWFPVEACRAPYRSTVPLADKHIPFEEVLQTWRCLIRRIPRWCVRAGVRIPNEPFIPARIRRSPPIGFLIRSMAIQLLITPSRPSSTLHLFLPLRVPLGATWHITRVRRNGIEESEICKGHEEKQEEVEDEDCDCCSMARRMDGRRRFE